MSEFIKIKITPDLKGLIAQLKGDIDAGLSAAMTNLVTDIESRAVKETPVKTSHLVNSITSYIANRGSVGTIKATAHYASFVHEGTGLYGPRKQKIVILPKDKKALFWYGAMHPVRRVEQKGQQPNPFFTRAIKGMNPQKVFEEGLQNYLRKRGH